MAQRIAIFASGSGTNAENIIKYFRHKPNIEVGIILSNRQDAFVLERAKKYGIETFVFDKKDFYATDKVLDFLLNKQIDLIVLAGFLWLVPKQIIERFEGRIINIHPALLPKYGGKGMYGDNVHRAVLKNKETQSGITIHYVNEKYDEGQIIFQAKCSVSPDDTPETLARKVHKLEYEFYPQIIETVLNKK